jgi:hypothetical protein
MLFTGTGHPRSERFRARIPRWHGDPLLCAVPVTPEAVTPRPRVGGGQDPIASSGAISQARADS